MNKRLSIIILCLFSLIIPLTTCLAQTKPIVNEQTVKKNKKQKQKKRETETRAYASYRDANSAGYELKNAGDLTASRDAYEAAMTFESTDRQKCEVYRALVSIYPELNQWEQMFEATEHIVENAPYPAFASLTVRSMISMVHRKKQQDLLFERYEAKLKDQPKDRTSLVILESATQQLSHDMPLRAEYLRRLIELDKEAGKAPDYEMQAQLAFTLRLSNNETESAELYEAIAKSDADYQAYCLAQAAESWQRAGADKKSIVAAKQASKLGPGVRANRSLYEWHRLLGDIFLKHLDKQRALKHYTAALENANIDPYRDQCREQLKLVNELK